MSKHLALLGFLCFLAADLRAADDFANDGLAIERDIDAEDDGSPADDGGTEANPDVGVAPAEPTPELEAPAEAPPERAPIVSEPERPSAPEGEKIFDWQKHKGEREVHHPFAEKGLVRITKDKTYLYKVDESDQRRAADLHVGPFNPYNLSNPHSDGAYASYEENYNGSAPAIMGHYEWQLWPTSIGKIGLRAGGGLFYSQGNGHFVTPTTRRPLEVFTFIALPANVGAVYRLQVWRRQALVPYGEAGGTLWAFAETRDDGKPAKFGGSASAYFAGGLALNLTYFNAISRVSLDREYGINAVYLLAEYRGIVGLSKNYDFTANFLNGGLLMEF